MRSRLQQRRLSQPVYLAWSIESIAAAAWPLSRPATRGTDSLFASLSFFLSVVGASVSGVMARGQQKIQSQQRNAERLAAEKKRQGGTDQKKAAQKALLFVCSVCKVRHCAMTA